MDGPYLFEIHEPAKRVASEVATAARLVDAAVLCIHAHRDCKAAVFLDAVVHGGTTTARGANGIRATMAAYIDLKPHVDVVTHHVTIAGDFAMTRSQWRITGQDKDGKPIDVHHHGMEVHRNGEDGTWYFFIDHPFGADASWAVERPPRTD